MVAFLNVLGPVGLHECEEHSELLEEFEKALLSLQQSEVLRDILDTTTGQVLKRELVQEARGVEMEYFYGKNVYTKRPTEEAVQVTGKQPVPVKWVDTNKGDDICPNYRSRLVAKDIRKKGEDTIFALTPPLESLRAVLSLLATPNFG